MTGQYDLIVIGAGIHGAGTAQAAAAAGYSVLVLEQSGIASATSCRSSKLIHGGPGFLGERHIRSVARAMPDCSSTSTEYPAAAAAWAVPAP